MISFKNKSKRLDPILLKFKLSAIGNVVGKIARSKRQVSYKGTKKGIKRNRFDVLNFSVARYRGYFFLAVLLILPLVLLIIHLNQYFKIELAMYIEPVEKESKSVDTNQMNVVFFGFSLDDDGHKFLDFIVVTSTNRQTGKLMTYGVNPYFLVESSDTAEDYTLKTLFNGINRKEKDPMDELMSKTEDLLGIRIDRYVAFEIDSKLESVLKTWDVGLELTGEDARSYGKDRVDKNDQFNFLFDKGLDADTRTRRSVLYMNSLASQKSNYIFYYKLFWDGESLAKIFFTDMNKSECYKLALALKNFEKPLNSSYLSSKFGVPMSNEDVEEGIVPDYILIDEDVKSIFSDIEIMQEQAKIEVFNATLQRGVALKKSRIIENVGSNVINYGNFPEKVEGNVLYILSEEPDKLKNTIKMIERTFRSKLRVTGEVYRYNYSGDLVLVIGSP